MKKIHSSGIGAAVAAVLTLAASSAFAEDADIEALKKTIAAQQAQLQALQQQLAAQQEALTKLEAHQTAVEDKAKLTAQDQSKVSMTNNRATISSADGRSSIALRALVQADFAHYDQSAAGPLATDFRRGSNGAAPNRETNGARDLSDGAYFRRARFGFEGTIARDFSYKFLTEFGGAGTEGPARINDAWIAYTGFAPFTFQFGAFSPPANMEDGTTPEDLLFIERASSSELSRALGGADGRLGFAIKATGARWLGSVTFTGRTVNDAEVFDSQNAVVARFAGLALTSSDYNLHIGASGTYVIHPPDAGVDAGGTRYGIRFRDRPELRVDSTRLIDTGAIDAVHAYSYGAELGGNWRNIQVQGEKFWYGIERRTGTLDDPTFGGWYLEGSWMVTGESRRYNMATGSYQNARPLVPFTSKGGYGAWELALRYSDTDLNFDAGSGGAALPNAVRGGEQDIWTLAVNWYLNSNFRLQFNYLDIDVGRLNPSRTGSLVFGPAPASPPFGAQIGQHLHAYALRSQFAF
jgi:phosphate-selective porin OprO/OprP